MGMGTVVGMGMPEESEIDSECECALLVLSDVWASFKYSTVVWPRAIRKRWNDSSEASSEKVKLNQRRPTVAAPARKKGVAVGKC